MRQLFEYLMQRPILIFVLVAWLAGMIGNAAKSVKKSRERSEEMRRMPSAEPPPVRAAGRPGAPGRPSADDVAAEMRRILGMEPLPRRATPPPEPPPAPRRRLVETERPPTPAVPTAQNRRLELHVAPHVGEQIGQREVLSRQQVDSGAMGSLGGRVHHQVRSREGADRFPRTNLRQALVLSEILGPPLALRAPDPARLQ